MINKNTNIIEFLCWGCETEIKITITDEIARNLGLDGILRSSIRGIIVKCPNCKRENYYGIYGANKGLLSPRSDPGYHNTCFRCGRFVNHSFNLSHTCGWLLCQYCHVCSPNCSDVCAECIIIDNLIQP